MAADLETLFRRATGGRSPDRSRMFRPSMVYRVLEDPYGVWCDYHAPPAEAVDETTRYEALRMKWGTEYEAAWVREHCPGAVEITERDPTTALHETFKAMLSGAGAIHAPQLWWLDQEIYGKGDLIVRSDERASDLGPFHYRVKEIKRSAKLKDYHRLQAAAYNRVLGHIQGYTPPEAAVVLKEGEESVAHDPAERELAEVLDTWRRLRDDEARPPLPGFDDARSPWRVYTNRRLEAERDLTLVPFISAATRRKLAEKLGVKGAEDLARLSVKDLQRALGPRTGEQFHHKYRALTTGQPTLVAGEPIQVPRADRHLYFDFETSDATNPGVPPHIYLIGAYDLEAERFVTFFANGPDEEESIFRKFVEYAGDPRTARLYHWTGFEIGCIDDLIERRPALAESLERLKGSCVDLKAAIEKKVYFASRTYSIKEVAPTLGFRWRQADVDAFESMVLYWEHLERPDPGKVERILKYNEDDCLAMVCVDRWLCTEAGVKGPFRRG